MALGDAAIAAENKRYLELPEEVRAKMAEDHVNSTWGVLILSWLMPVQWAERSAAYAEAINKAAS